MLAHFTQQFDQPMGQAMPIPVAQGPNGFDGDCMHCNDLNMNSKSYYKLKKNGRMPLNHMNFL
jgi:hypothetical protein